MSAPLRITLIILLALAVPILPFALIGELPGERWLSATDNNAVVFGLTGAALLAGDVLLPIPSSLLGSLLGARLGFFPGFVCAWFGMFTGNVAGYWAGRWLFGRLAVRLPETPSLAVLFLSRPVPVLAEAMTIPAGAARMNFAHFCMACGAGNALYAAALAGNGAALLPDALLGPGLVLPMLLPVVAWLAWRWLAHRQPLPK
jgi:membrane protein DedA with SNARE-associated domain